MNYSYPQVQAGYRFNMTERITQEVGIAPIGTCDESAGDTMMTTITFADPLTDDQKAKLDALMADNPTFPPTTSGTVFKIWDIYERLADFNAQCGTELRIYYSESVPGSGVIDQIELHAPTTLSDSEKARVLSAWAGIIQ
jgi:hypothetical protein